MQRGEKQKDEKANEDEADIALSLGVGGFGVKSSGSQVRGKYRGRSSWGRWRVQAGSRALGFVASTARGSRSRQYLEDSGV